LATRKNYGSRTGKVRSSGEGPREIGGHRPNPGIVLADRGAEWRNPKAKRRLGTGKGSALERKTNTRCWSEEVRFKPGCARWTRPARRTATTCRPKTTSLRDNFRELSRGGRRGKAASVKNFPNTAARHGRSDGRRGQVHDRAIPRRKVVEENGAQISGSLSGGVRVPTCSTCLVIRGRSAGFFRKKYKVKGDQELNEDRARKTGRNSPCARAKNSISTPKGLQPGEKPRPRDPTESIRIPLALNRPRTSDANLEMVAP